LELNNAAGGRSQQHLRRDSSSSTATAVEPAVPPAEVAAVRRGSSTMDALREMFTQKKQQIQSKLSGFDAVSQFLDQNYQS
jgi:hypothetical protein